MECDDSRQLMEVSLIHTDVSMDEFVNVQQEQEHGQDSCGFPEELRQDARGDTGPASSSQATVNAAYINEHSSECFVQVSDPSQGVDSEVLSLSDAVMTACEFETDKLEQVQTLSDFGSSGIVQPAVSCEGEDLLVSVHTENDSDMDDDEIDHAATDRPIESTDHLSLNPIISHNIAQIQNDISISLNGPSSTDDVPSFTDKIISFPDMKNVQMLPDLSITYETNRAEDQTTSADGNPDGTEQRLLESHVLSEGSITDHFSLGDCVTIVPCSSSAVEAEIFQLSHLPEPSFAPAENVQTESCLIVPDPVLSSVTVKEETQCEDYELALAQSAQRSPQGESTIQQSQTSKVTDSSSSDVITTISSRGKKRRVRIVVIKGEWRKPKTKKRNRDQQRSASSSSQKPGFAGRPVPTSSAIPTALFRNIHVKAEPQIELSSIKDCQQTNAHSDNTDTSPHKQALSSASTSSHGEVSSNCPTTSQQTECLTPVTETESCTAPSAISSSLFCSRANGRKRRRERRQTSFDNASSASKASTELKTTSEKIVESWIQPCGVRLRRLPSHIAAAGMVDLKNDPKILLGVASCTVSSRLGKRPCDSKRPWECELCGKTYKTKSARTQHYKVHSGLREHLCTICNASFAYKSVLTSHHRFVHLKEKPHECPVCGKRFGWSSHLSTHLSRHYEHKPYTCPICHQQFNSLYIKKHLDTHSNIRPFQCTICKGKYRTKRALQEHEKIHSGLKPFKCDRCGQQFPYSNSLVAHMRTHTGERPFSCPKCPSTFRQSTHLRTHLKGVHKVKSFPTKERRESVQRVFPQPPSHVSKGHFQLMNHTLSQIGVLEKQVQQMNKIRTEIGKKVKRLPEHSGRRGKQAGRK